MYIRQLTEISDKTLWKKVEKAKELFRLARKYKLSEEMIEKIANHIERNQLTGGYRSWQTNLNYWWRNVAWYQPMREQFIESKLHLFTWDNISCNQHLTDDFIVKNSSRLNWDFLCKYVPLSESVMEKFIDLLDWKEVCAKQEVSEQFILKYQNNIIWHYLMMNRYLAKDFFERNKHLITVKLYASDLVRIIEGQTLSEETLKEIKKGKMAWSAISGNCSLSKEFVLKNYKHIDAHKVMRNYKTDKEVREEVEMIEKLSGRR